MPFDRKDKIMNIKHITLFLIAAVSLFAVSAFADIRVVAVKGSAAYKEGAKWLPLKPGLKLAVGTKVSTGVRSRVEIKINNHIVIVQPLTIMKISESRDDATSSTTSLGLRRGSLRTLVARDAKIKTDFKVSTPVATSSVRGTWKIDVSSPGFGMHIIILKDTVQGQGLNGGPLILSGDLLFWQKPGKGDSESPLTGLDDFITKTHSKFITPDEEEAFGLFGDDFQFYEPGQRGAGGPGVTVPVTIYLIWPRLP